MPRCKNCPKHSFKPCYYTGLENTPRGKGYSAKYEDEGKRMKGTNGKTYEVSGGKWILVKKKLVSPRGFKEGDDLRYEEDPHLYRPTQGELLENLRAGEMMKYGDNFDEEKLKIIDELKTITPDGVRVLMGYPLNVVRDTVRIAKSHESDDEPFDIIEIAEEQNRRYEQFTDEIIQLAGELPPEKIEKLGILDSVRLVFIRHMLREGKELNDYYWW